MRNNLEIRWCHPSVSIVELASHVVTINDAILDNIMLGMMLLAFGF